jgi:nitroreductase
MVDSSAVRNGMLDLIFNRRSIRKFRSKPVGETDVWKIIGAGQRAPTACNFQNYSIVWVKNSELRNKVLKACKVPCFMKNAQVVFVICADVQRFEKVLDHLTDDHCFKHGHGYWIKLMSIMDACFVAENMTIAAECLGLGSVYIGFAFANDEVIKELRLPKDVLPLTLLCVGYPDESPPIRPRWSMSSVLHIDRYHDPVKGEVKQFLERMNRDLDKERHFQKYTGSGAPQLYSEFIENQTLPECVDRKDASIVRVLKHAGFFPSEAS